LGHGRDPHGLAVIGGLVAQFDAQPSQGGLVHRHRIGLAQGLDQIVGIVDGHRHRAGHGVDGGDVDELHLLGAGGGGLGARLLVLDDVLPTPAGPVQVGDGQDLGVLIDQRHDAPRHARGAAVEQGRGPGAQDHDVGAGAVDLGRKGLADPHEHADLGQHQQARKGERHNGGHVAAPLVEQG
jgi:hypothetical protein